MLPSGLKTASDTQKPNDRPGAARQSSEPVTASESQNVPSELALAIRDPVGSNATELIDPPWPCTSVSARPSAASWTRRFPSSIPVASERPSGEKSTAPEPGTVNNSPPPWRLMSQIFTWPSSLAVASLVPSALKDTQLTSAVCPPTVMDGSAPSGVSLQTIAVPSVMPVAKNGPSAKPTLLKLPEGGYRESSLSPVRASQRTTRSVVKVATIEPSRLHAPA